ncbi:uncharacterized protein LOC133552410 [Nerophis ophidion]|uniref:uncharacterized protein LOC133552410 n=1 Tax=Nerophis ophidion TaxID=159077 RepID=UPI002AE09CFC|nr:uncharacterized protein LOC133552410 [Nerophis ophidion]
MLFILSTRTPWKGGNDRLGRQEREDGRFWPERRGINRFCQVNARRLVRNPRTTQQTPQATGTNPKTSTTGRGRGNSAAQVSAVLLWICGDTQLPLAVGLRARASYAGCVVLWTGGGAIWTQRPAETPGAPRSQSGTGTATWVPRVTGDWRGVGVPQHLDVELQQRQGKSCMCEDAMEGGGAKIPTHLLAPRPSPLYHLVF